VGRRALLAACIALAAPAQAQPVTGGEASAGEAGEAGEAAAGPASAGEAAGEAAAGPASAGEAAGEAAAGPASAAASAGEAAGEAGGREGAARTDMEPGALPVLGALMPGVLVHGTGHRIGGDRRTANRLLRVEALALGIAAAGGVPLGLTGASRRLALPTIPLIVGGGGMLFLNWFSDIYGAAGGPRLAGAPRLVLPGLEGRLRYVYVYDPQFAYRSFVNPGARLRLGAWHADVDAALALDDDNQRVRVEGGRRVHGPLPGGGAPSQDGSALGLDTALTMHRFGSDGFVSLLGEVVGRGRYDLARVAPSLSGAFAELWLGLGLEFVFYDGDTVDPTDWLLGGFAFGMYLGEPGRTHGEVRVFYDHFRGDLSGGLAVPGGGNGYWGSLGVDGFVAWGPRWGVSFWAEAGSAYLAGAGILYRRP
jgi:hypothetical protein